MEQQATKGVLASILVVIAHLTNSLGVLFFVFLAFLILDFFTGMGAAHIEGKINSISSINGILKKIAYIGLVVTGILFDLTLNYATKEIGISLPLKSIFGFLIICWLIANEAVSIAENLKRMGAPVPTFLLKGFKIFQKAINNVGETNTDIGNDNDK